MIKKMKATRGVRFVAKKEWSCLVTVFLVPELGSGSSGRIVHRWSSGGIRCVTLVMSCSGTVDLFEIGENPRPGSEGEVLPRNKPGPRRSAFNLCCLAALSLK